jgi:hypothetical protein
MVNGHIVKDGGILNADDMAPSLGVNSYREWIRRMTVDSRAARVMLDGIAIGYEPLGTPIIATVNHGRWVGICECGGAEIVTPNDPIFFCFSCYNLDNKYHVRPVAFPHEKEQAAISAVLMERDHKDMHWTPGETVEVLKGQNKVLREAKKSKKEKE